MRETEITAIPLHVFSTIQTVKEYRHEETTMIITNPYEALPGNDPIDGREARRKRRAEERKKRKY